MRIQPVMLLLLAAALFMSACSSNFSERTRLTSSGDHQYNHHHAQSGSSVPNGGCATETVARRPYPSYVVVARGENLCRIAKRYETTVQAIVDANRLPSPILPVGMHLQLPSPHYYSRSPFGQLRRR